MRASDFAPIDSYLFICAAIDYATDALNSLTYLFSCGSPLGAFKKQMLGEVGDARFFFGLVAGAGTPQDNEAYRAAVRHSAGDYPQAIIEHNFVVHRREFLSALLLAVSEAPLFTDVQSFSFSSMVEC